MFTFLFDEKHIVEVIDRSAIWEGLLSNRFVSKCIGCQWMANIIFKKMWEGFRGYNLLREKGTNILKDKELIVNFANILCYFNRETTG